MPKIPLIEIKLSIYLYASKLYLIYCFCNRQTLFDDYTPFFPPQPACVPNVAVYFDNHVLHIVQSCTTKFWINCEMSVLRMYEKTNTYIHIQSGWSLAKLFQFKQELLDLMRETHLKLSRRSFFLIDVVFVVAYIRRI